MQFKKQKVSLYIDSPTKRLLDIVLSIFFILITLPISGLVAVLILLTSGWPIFFVHKRNGKNGRVIGMIKFRSMINGAARLQKKFSKLNESDGPTFKIQNDPRFTRVGRALSRTGLDELPQFINVIRGDMSIVGPRPLPVLEARRLSKSQKVRELIKPGATSNWVIEGSHTLSFKKWMSLDKMYLENASFLLDIQIIYGTFYIMLRSLVTRITNH